MQEPPPSRRFGQILRRVMVVEQKADPPEERGNVVDPFRALDIRSHADERRRGESERQAILQYVAARAAAEPRYCRGVVGVFAGVTRGCVFTAAMAQALPLVVDSVQACFSMDAARMALDMAA